MTCFAENLAMASKNTSPVFRRIIGCAGLLLIILNLLGIICLGVDIAIHGIFSTQSWYNPGLPLRLLPLAAFVLGVVTGGALLEHRPWARVLTIYYAVLLALAAPLWAQQLSLGYLIYTSQRPPVLPVVLMCLAAVAFVVAAIVIMRRRPVAQIACAPIIAPRRRSIPWLVTNLHYLSAFSW